MQTRLKRVLAINANTDKNEEVEVIESFRNAGDTFLLVRRSGEGQVHPISYGQIVEVLEHETTESQMEKVKKLWSELFGGLLPGLGGRSTDEYEYEDEPEDDEESDEIGITTEELRDLHEHSKKNGGENKVETDEDKAALKNEVLAIIEQKTARITSYKQDIETVKKLETLSSFLKRLEDGEDPNNFYPELLTI